MSAVLDAYIRGTTNALITVVSLCILGALIFSAAAIAAFGAVIGIVGGGLVVVVYFIGWLFGTSE